MRIGQLDRRIIIQQASESQSAFGDMAITWATLRTVWTHIIYKSGSEKDEANRMTDITEIIFTIRYASDVTKNIKKWTQKIQQKIQQMWIALKTQIAILVKKMKKIVNAKMMKKKIDKFFLKDDIK